MALQSSSRKGSRQTLTVHVVGRHFTGLVACLHSAAGAHASVRHWTGAVPSASVRDGDLVVVDLLNLPDSVTYAQIASLADRARLLGIVGDGPVSGRWLAAPGHQNIEYVFCDNGSRSDGFKRAVAAVARHLGAPPAAELAAAIVRRTASFMPVESLIAAICGDPWSIRRPADLATAIGQRRSTLTATLKELGYARTEHFITAVRTVTVEVLRSDFGRRGRAAWLLAGVSDVSNHRRQAARALRKSGAAVHQLRAGLAIVLAGFAVLTTACRSKDAANDVQAATVSRGTDSTLSLPVVGALVRRGDLILSVRATGAVRADRLVSLKSETQGTVAEVPVQPGQHVAAGAVLVRLDPRPLDIAVREAEASVEEARMRMRDALLGDRPGDTTEIVLSRRESARQRSGIVAAEARLERAQLERERAVVTAPFAGVLDQVSVVVGQHLNPGDAIARLVDLGTLTIEAAVLEHDLPLIRVGGQAAVMPSAAAGTRLPGVVIAVLPLVDTTSRSGRVLIRVRAGEGALRPGMYADVELESMRLTNRIVVPAAAVIERDGRPLVFRSKEGRADWVYLMPGRSNGAETEILPDTASGRPPIEPGDTVLVAGHLTLTHDAPVRVQLRSSSRPGQP